MKIIDTHAHLDHLENIHESLPECYSAGVAAVLAVSENLDACKRNLEIKLRYSKPAIHLAFGIHPSYAHTENVDEFIAFVSSNKQHLAAIGEIGLDYWYRWVRKNDDKKNRQIEVFRRCLVLSKELNLPVSIHSRGAWADCIKIVKDEKIERAVFHWYSGPVEILKDILDSGYYVSVTPSLAYSKESKEAAVYAPVDRILVETDTPVFFKIDENEAFKSTPKHVLKTLEYLCKIKKLQEDSTVKIVNQNAADLFSIYVV